MSQPTRAIVEAESAGIDVSLLDANLGYSYEQRALLHQGALDLALEIARVGRQLYGDTQSTPLPSL
jgi:hypothetical protein